MKVPASLLQRFLGLALILGVFALHAQARLYVGVNGDYVAGVLKDSQRNNAVSVYPNITLTNPFKAKSRGYGGGIIVGAEDYYSCCFGTRYGIGAGYLSFEDSQWIDAEFNFDLLLDLFKTRDFGIGIFGGMGADYDVALKQRAQFLNLGARMGISTLILENHRLEFWARIPVVSIRINSKSLLFSKTILSLGYKIIF